MGVAYICYGPDAYLYLVPWALFFFVLRSWSDEGLLMGCIRCGEKSRIRLSLFTPSLPLSILFIYAHGSGLVGMSRIISDSTVVRYKHRGMNDVEFILCFTMLGLLDIVKVVTRL